MNSYIPLPFSPINDQRQCSNLLLTQDIVDKPGHLNTDWLLNNKWALCLVESASHFDKSDADKISHALKIIGCEKCFAVATEHLDNFPHCFQLSATSEGLLDFSDECGHLNFVIVPKNRSFAILCTVYDYFIVAGNLEFVNCAVGGDMKAARAKFNEVTPNDW